MIGRLAGKVLEQTPDGTVLVDVGGVGYELLVPLGTIGRARHDEMGRILLWVHTHVREDTLALFGFADEHERTTFRCLLGVSNVGPKIAVAVLSALPAAELARAVARRDLAALTSVSGIGKKIAERLLLELRDKLPSPVIGAPARAPASADAAPVGSTEDQLKGALTGMGFKPAEADRALAVLAARPAGERLPPLEELLREALALLAR